MGCEKCGGDYSQSCGNCSSEIDPTMLSGKEALLIIESEFPQLNYAVDLKEAWQTLNTIIL
jgi:hypothetical protein